MADTNRLFWGKLQEIHLKKRCMGMPSIVAPIMDSRGHRHYQYNSIVLVKVQLAEQCKMAKKITKTLPIELYKVLSSQGTTLSPCMQCIGMHDENGSHHELGHVSRVSEENKVEESYNSNEY